MSSVRAPDVERHLIDSLVLLMDNPELVEEVAKELDVLLEADRPAVVDRAGLEAKMRRLDRLYEDGLKSDEEYVRERDTLRAQLNAPITPVVLPNATHALEVLGGVPTILQEADTTDRRAVLKQLFTNITLEPHIATKAKARDEYRELLLNLDQRVEGTDWWAGWGIRP